MDSGQQQSKRPRSVLAGSYGHPVHPILVTIPIGAWICAFVFDLVSFGSSSPRPWAVGAMWLILIGVIGAALAAIFGALDMLNIPRRTVAFNTARLHAVLNSAALVIFLINFFWRYRTAQSWEAAPTGPFVLTIVGLAVISVSGFLGGKLAYHYGVRVADESVQRKGFRERRTDASPQ